jgi:hypothetical protein
MLKSLLVGLVLATVVAGGAPAANAGTTGVLSGYLVDETSHRRIPLPHVNVHAGWETTTTDSRGFFAFVSLAPGLYPLYALFDGRTPPYRYGCGEVAVVSADQGTIATLWVDSFDHPVIYDCVWDTLVRPTDQFGEYSFDADGNPEPR